MTPATPVSKREEIKTAEEGFFYKCRTAVSQLLPVTQNDVALQAPVRLWNDSTFQA